MSFYITVLYPRDDESTFDMDYYKDKHMPLVFSKWGPMGMKGYKILEFTDQPDGSKSAYSVGCLLEWEDREKTTAASKTEATKIILDDIKEFSNREPMFLGGDVRGTN
jgi:uncharacterized protein (TIGR02118 family)